MPRLFFAIETAPELKNILVGLQDTLGRAFRSLPSVPDLKPERIMNSHCTVRFLGNVETKKIEPLVTETKRAIDRASLPKFHCRLATVGVFPDLKQARVLWIGLVPEEPFRRIQHSIDEALSETGITIEDGHRFHPHLTLFRFRQSFRFPPEFIFPAVEPSDALVSEVTLMESQTLPAGPIHTVRARFEFV